MSKVSVIIPSRNEPFLQKTITDLLTKARGPIEIIAVLDGYWPNPSLTNDERLKVIHKGKAEGMRAAINSGVALASGEYLLKADAHTMWDEGFDEKLKQACQDNWVVVPRRHRLEPETWTLQEVEKPPVDYEYLCYPDDEADFGGRGLHGRKWNERTRERMDKVEYEIDDLMSFQGSAWFMKKSYFHQLDLMDDEHYGSFNHEAQEIGLKCWLSGGRVVVNKKTWYAHLHKGKKYGRGYPLDGRQLIKGTNYTNKWLEGKAWDKQTKPLSWLIEKFWPVPTWPEDRSLWAKPIEDTPLPEEKQEASPVKEEKQDTLTFIMKKYNLEGAHKLPIEIPNTSRETLAQDLKELGFKIGVEVGTEEGAYAEIICKNNPEMKLYCIDPWEPYPGYREHVSVEKYEGIMQRFKDRMNGYNAIPVRKYSMDAVKDFKDNSLDFVYIDANHEFRHVVDDISEWIRKVRPGGIIAGHDYTKRKNTEMTMQIPEAVHGYTQAYKISPWFVLGRKDRKEGEIREKTRSWFWVKQ